MGITFGTLAGSTAVDEEAFDAADLAVAFMWDADLGLSPSTPTAPVIETAVFDPGD